MSSQVAGLNPPKVFISYSHDSQVHKDRVLELANRLRAEGVDCNIDQYEESPPEGWPRWMMNQLDWTDFVLIICTDQYNRRFRGLEEPGKGRGVTWEGGIITQELYDAHVRSNKFIPIVFSAEDREYIPIPLRGFSSYELATEEGYLTFYRRVTNQPLTEKPSLGEVVKLPPRALLPLPSRDRKQFFLDDGDYLALRAELREASKGLLAWKRTLGNNQSIERPELAQLLNRIKTDESSVTIVLGGPGSGKSALLAELGNRLVNDDVALLAIKADYLSNTVRTLEDLQRDDQLQLSRNPQEAIKALANRERVVLLVDQLDALSELLDRKPERLNVLLMLIQSLAKTKNVHIVATCREFEFRHGTQFARLEEFERLDLSLLTCEQISPLLEKAGYFPGRMGEPLWELLQNPLHLDIFLKVAIPGEVFESSQKLLDRLWEERIRRRSDAAQCIAFLERVANRMTQEEMLWLPTAFADDSIEIYQTLEQAGILMVNLDNSTFGFRHQTYYDHTLARAFVCGSQSLVEFVLERQDGLFVRPILLRSLNYLRGTAPNQYQQQLRSFLTTEKERLRPHIYTLLIEFVGTQAHPTSGEAWLLLPLLNSDTEGPKVLDAMTGSPGWFARLCEHPGFWQWLEKPPEQAAYCSSLLSTATSFSAEGVWSLLEEYWLNDSAYDPLSVRIIWGIAGWTPERVWLIQQVLQRYWVDWHTVAAIAEKVTETLPDLAPKIIRAHLDQRLAQAIAASNVPPPELPPGADEVQRSLHAYQHDRRNPLKHVLESESDFYEIEEFAKTNPKAFLNEIWSWFIDLIHRLTYDESPVTQGYRIDCLLDFRFDRGNIIQSLITAIEKLAKQDKPAFLNFVAQNVSSDLLSVHRLLTYGLEQIASQEPLGVLEYLLADSKRLSLGDKFGRERHRDTEKLIIAICLHLQPKHRIRLEQAILNWNYWQVTHSTPADDRRKFFQYNREHRLTLLQAFPDECLSAEAKRLKEQEERNFPWVNPTERGHPIVAEIVGPRMTKEEMSRAADQHLLNLFDELSDETGWDHPRRRFSGDLSRAGGAVQQSGEFGELIKDDPGRFLRILPQLQPQRHESYVGDALGKLAEIDFSADYLIQLVETLDQRGFVSEEFRSNAASAINKVAERNQGLPQSTIALLESWLETHSQPELEHYRSKQEHSNHDLKSPILFGIGGSHTLPGGRGNIVRAIADGYLKQQPPDLENWARFIRSRLGIEPHPAVWVDILVEMPRLLNGDRTKATELFDAVIQHCPEVLQYPWALYFISRTVGWFEPVEIVQGWLEMLLAANTSFSQQAYGELLLIYYFFQYQDEWSMQQINCYLTEQGNEAVLCGLAHAAAHLWKQGRCREIAAKIIATLASTSHEPLQKAVASIFHWNREDIVLDKGMRQVIQAICANRAVLIEAASDLIESIEEKNWIDQAPQIVKEICQSLVALGTELTNPARPIVFVAEGLTTIAIQLHRQYSYREEGLQLFEHLLALNLRETRSALEMLDRRPNRLSSFVAPRRRLRRRPKPRR